MKKVWLFLSLFVLRAALKSAARDVTRFQMAAVCIHPKGIVSTDGKRMFIGSYPDPEDGETTWSWPKGWPSDGFIIGRGDVETICKGTGADVVLVSYDPDKRTCTLQRGAVETTCTVVEGTYPPFEKAIPTGHVFEIVLSPEYLADACAAAKLLTTKESRSMRLSFKDYGTAVLITTEGVGHGKHRQVLMPLVTTNDGDRERPHPTAPESVAPADATVQSVVELTPQGEAALAGKSKTKSKRKSKTTRRAPCGTPMPIPVSAPVDAPCPQTTTAPDTSPVETSSTCTAPIVYAYTIKKDGSPKSCRVRFDDAPDDATRADLKSNGWRWIRGGKYWVHKADRGPAMLRTFPDAVHVDVVD